MVEVLLNNVADVKTFCNLASGLLSDVDVISGRYVHNGKSIMGLFDLDLTQPIKVIVHEVVPSEKDQFEGQLRNLGLVVN